MMDIRLDKMVIRYFKGIREFVLDLNGSNGFIYADNGKGKTTVRDAFLWCLFGKDGSNRSDSKFSIETFQPGTNEPIHNVDHIIELYLTIDRTPLKLKRLYAEKWAKKNGELEKKLDGHTTSYWINDEPLKEKDYQDRIGSIVSEKIFKLITNPACFNEQLKWEERRKILLEISGDMTDLEVIQSDPKLAKLKDILGNKTIDGLKNMINDKLGTLNKEIEKIPARIDENYRSLPTEEVDYSSIESESLQFKDRLAGIETEQADVINQANVLRQKHQSVSQLQLQIDARKKVIDEQANAGFKRLIDEKALLEKEKYRLEQDNQGSNDRLTLMIRGIADIEKEMDELREKWHAENKKEFVPPERDSFICPTCLRPLSEEEQAETIAELKDNFQRNKKSTCEEITSKGQTLAVRKTDLEDNLGKIREQVFTNDVKLREIDERSAEIDKELTQPEKPQVNYGTDEEYRSLLHKLDVLQAELKKPVEDSNSELLQKKQEVAARIEELNKTLNQRETAEKTRARIEELGTEEKRLSQQISELNGQKFLIEQFIKRKVNLLEGSINSKFKTVRFEMFYIQINGGLKECCNTLVQADNGAWVDWNTNGSTAQRLNAGIDIINTLSAHYGVKAPIFADNRESVNRLIETNSQVINLIVSDDQELRVEVA